VMGERGMADMAEMQMPLPDNTVPMMTGDGPFGSVEMGGMFTMLKVRKEQAAGDYRDPGWFKHPAGTVAHEWKGELANPSRSHDGGGQSMPLKQPLEAPVEVQVRKPGGHAGH
jgi:manganese oxidase